MVQQEVAAKYKEEEAEWMYSGKGWWSSGHEYSGQDDYQPKGKGKHGKKGGKKGGKTGGKKGDRDYQPKQKEEGADYQWIPNKKGRW